MDVKISLITVTFNAADTIEKCIQSVIGQTYKNVEYIVIDGKSSDDTVQIINKYKAHIQYFVSEPDRGIYDALNKGISVATGDIVGALNADDFFVDNRVLESVADVFNHKKADILYGDLDYINHQGKVIRQWRSGGYTPGKFNRGWMPPHPTFYCRKELFDKYGLYSLNFGTAADFELMLRFMYKHHHPAFYLKQVLVKMKIGGVSNQNIIAHVKGLLNDFKAMRINGIKAPLFAVFLKPLRKIGQYFRREA